MTSLSIGSVVVKYISLHWLPIPYRIQYKVALTMFFIHTKVLPTLALSSPISIITPHVNVSVQQLALTTQFLKLGRSSANDRSRLLVRPSGILYQKLFAPSPTK